MTHDHLDALIEAARVMQKAHREVPALWKADIGTAFRHIPVSTQDTWVATVVFKHGKYL